MKKILYILGVMLAVASCTKDDEFVGAAQSDGYVTLSAGSPTRVTADGTAWQKDDKVLVVTKTAATEYSYLDYTISNAGTGAMSPDTDSDKIKSGESLTYYAYYPREDGDGNAHKCDITTSQKPLLTTDKVTSSGESVNLQFKHQYAKLTINLTQGTVSDFSDAKVKISGAYLKGEYNAANNIIGNVTKSDLTLDVINSKVTTYIIPYATAIDIVVTAGGNNYASKIESRQWVAGNSYSYNITVGREED